MRRTKKTLAVFMAALLALPLFCSVALAEGGHSFVVEQTVTGETTGGSSQYTYLIYQMLKGEAAKAGNSYVLSNVDWGSSVTDASKTAMYGLASLTDASQQSAQNFADWLAEQGESVFHQILNHVGSNDGSALTDAKTLTYGTWGSAQGYGIADLEPGYYLVRNTKAPDGVTFSDYIVRVVGENTVVQPKSGDTPTSQKKVLDAQDSTGAVSTAQDSADYDIGDTIPFALSFTLPSNYASYNEYRMVMLDDLSAGLTLDQSSIKLYFDGVQKDAAIGTTKVLTTKETIQVPTAHDTVSVELEPQYAGGALLTYYIADLKDLDNSTLTNGSTIRLEYNATLNDKAVVGSAGNANSFRVQYTNNPTVTDSLGTTPEDKNKVFVYQTILNKVDENGKPLSGAAFKLEKFVKDDGGTEQTSIEDVTYTGSWVDVTQLHSGAGAINPTYTKSATTAQGTEGEAGYVAPVADAVHTFKGLDDGKYRLTETTTPSGYNTMNPVQFTITANHDVVADDPALTQLNGAGSSGFILEASTADGSLTGNVTNKAGATLPTTGGMGTTALYVVGSVLVAGSAMALVVKRRMQA